MNKLTDIQFTLLTKLAVGDKIRRRYSPRGGFWFEATSPAGAEIEIGGRLGKRGLTVNTLDGLTKKGFLKYDDFGLGSWQRTEKGISE